jgi:hypothetical protein
VQTFRTKHADLVGAAFNYQKPTVRGAQSVPYPSEQIGFLAVDLADRQRWTVIDRPHWLNGISTGYNDRDPSAVLNLVGLGLTRLNREQGRYDQYRETGAKRRAM